LKERKRQIRNRLHDSNSRLPDDLSLLLRPWLFNLRSNPRNDYLRKQCFSKFVSSDTAPADIRIERAVAKWLATEEKNRETNLRIEHTIEDYNILPHISWREFVLFGRALTERILGAMPTWDSLTGIFSGGATTSRPRTASHPAQKYIGKADITEDALPLFESLLDDLPVWLQLRGDSEIRIVPGNIMFTVPKTTDIDRCACKEPDLNMFIQKGLGSSIRKSLRREGIDLNDQTINQRLARQGSIDGSLATLDLSSASDSITSGLVELFLPDIWFSILNQVRSPVTEIDGELHRNEMFSSMGNGFTFELESLLFYVLARTTAYFRGVSGVISVYGDDIIVPTGLAHDLISVLSYFGFSVNTSKSFWEGPFRESCGGHYYNGHDITPFYVKAPVTDLVSLIHLGNQVRQWAGLESYQILDPDCYEIWAKLKSLVPPTLWGGRDLSFKGCLVTPDLPSRRLLPVTTKDIDNLDGGYVLWLNATMDRTEPTDAVKTAFRRTDTGRYRVKPASRTSTWLLSPFFYEEVSNIPI